MEGLLEIVGVEVMAEERILVCCYSVCAAISDALLTTSSPLTSTLIVD